MDVNMATCHNPPRDRKAVIDPVGRELTARFGKRRFYTKDEVSWAADRAGVPVDFVCWAMCVFMDAASFREHHTAMGEACDYDAMRASMLASLGPDLGIRLPEIDWSGLQMPEFPWPDFEWPEIDLAAFFNWG